jgi:hypothetical protein
MRLKVVHIRNDGKTIIRIKIINYSHKRDNYGSTD